MSWRWVDSWHKKVYGISKERKCCRTEVALLGSGAQGRKRHCKRVQGHARREFLKQLAEGGCARHRRNNEEQR